MKINMNFVTIIICFLLSWHDPLFASCFLSSCFCLCFLPNQRAVTLWHAYMFVFSCSCICLHFFLLLLWLCVFFVFSLSNLSNRHPWDAPCVCVLLFMCAFLLFCWVSCFLFILFFLCVCVLYVFVFSLPNQRAVTVCHAPCWFPNPAIVVHTEEIARRKIKMKFLLLKLKSCSFWPQASLHIENRG